MLGEELGEHDGGGVHATGEVAALAGAQAARLTHLATGEDAAGPLAQLTRYLLLWVDVGCARGRAIFIGYGRLG